MIDELQPYPEYKDSGLPWLGQIPSHWDVRRTKYVFREVDRRSTTGEETQLSMSQTHGLVESSKIDTWRMRSESYVGGKLCEAGDLVLNRLKAHLGVFAHARMAGVISPDYSVFRPMKDANSRYFESVLKTPLFVAEIRRFTKGIVEGFWRLYTDDFYNLTVPFPPPSEQAAVVRFLEHADRRIRRYIRAKRQLIALLNEQKQAIIHRAVTRGLDPNVKLKPSGVDWLGDVPEHWDVRRLRFVADSIKTGDCDTVDRVDDGEYPFFVRSQNVERINTYSFDGEAVLTAGDGAGVARVFHYINGRFDYHQRVYKFSDFRDVRARFFFHYFSATLRFEAFRETAKSTVDSLRLPMLKDFPVPVPSVSEQDEIASVIDQEVVEIERAVDRVVRELALIREYRTRLIADVVTGKRDVRDAVSRLPEEVEEGDAGTEDLLDDEEVADDAELDAEPEEVEA